MKIFYLLFLFLVFEKTFGDTCVSPITRTTNAANSVLTSVKYNLDHDTAYAQVNALPGTCVTDGTIGIDELNVASAELDALVNSPRVGCAVSYSDATTLSVSKCRLGLNDVNLNTTSAATVAFGCTNCSAEAASTTYYLYAASSSSNDYLNLLISTSVPDALGESSSSKVLARFYNDTSQNIDQYSIDQWNGYRFNPQNTGWISGGTTTWTALTSNPTKSSTASIDAIAYRREGKNMQLNIRYRRTGTNGATQGSGDQLVYLPANYYIDFGGVSGLQAQGASTGTASWINVGGVGSFSIGDEAGAGNTNNAIGNAIAYDQRRIKGCYLWSDNSNIRRGCMSGSSFGIGSATVHFEFIFKVPIVGWSD